MPHVKLTSIIDMKIIILTLLFAFYCESAVRFGIYSAASCNEADLVGFAWYPGPNEEGYPATSCTESWAGGQYYDVQKGLPEVTQAERPTDWNYIWMAALTQVDCSTISDTSASVFATKPDVCVHYFSTVPGGNALNTAMMLSNCTSQGLPFYIGGTEGCGAPSTYSETCEEIQEWNTAIVAYCATDSIAPTSQGPVANTPQTGQPQTSSPTAAPQTAPQTAPQVTPASGPDSTPRGRFSAATRVIPAALLGVIFLVLSSIYDITYNK